MSSFLFDVSNENKVIAFEITPYYLGFCDRIEKRNYENVFNYLEKGIYCDFTFYDHKDIFTKQYIDHPETLRTDGYWVWSADINFYVKYHNLQLCKSFLNYIEERNGIEVGDDRIDLIMSKYGPTFGEIMNSKRIPDKNLLELGSGTDYLISI